MDKLKESLFRECVFATDCKNKYRGFEPPCFALVEKLKSDNKQSAPLMCDRCAAPVNMLHKFCWQCGNKLG